MTTSWYVFALLSVIALAGAELSQKIALTHKANISAITNNFFVWIIQGIGGLFIVMLFQESNFSLFTIPWIRLLVVGLLYFAGGSLYYTSFKANSASVSMILVSVSVVISTTLGILFFGESTDILKFVSISLILSSIIFSFNSFFIR